ncbi:hypothetical protein RYX45_01525 [Alkalihalophilus pseudofirmus]|uniref:Uncharacterized protein n=1 Tax=Alkalihalophilus pseudofirmus TaxID=79885 RepID=A0AAJ2KY09_ALKPS|nr:hypothetical protein [Alkalihalophilus pseudofirmus]MDV2883843.1 hypothetical protein [Alkalihalophilus pseudofirmus]
MPYIFLGEDNKTVERIIYNASSFTEDELKDGILVEEIPQEEPKRYKVARLVYESGRLFYHYVERPLTPDEEIEIIKEENESLKQSQAEQDQLIMDLLLR